MSSPVLSIITPTKDREAFLPGLWRCLEAQTVQDFEWLVHDDGVSPSPFLSGLAGHENRVSYSHAAEMASIGQKRNQLIASARGDIIIHMDDDDYYAPHYIETMLTLMARSKADFVKLFGFHLFHQRTGMFAYWDLEHAFPLHHMLHPEADDFPLGPKEKQPNEEWGYGFSYVYRRTVWEAQAFADTSNGEDKFFAEAAVKSFSHAGMQDTSFAAVHVIHGSNTSYAYPQQLLPQAFGEAYFPGFIRR
jgi:glycosyltransferase involved in cell wall biosynthesis